VDFNLNAAIIELKSLAEKSNAPSILKKLCIKNSFQNVKIPAWS
jgi:hypothetical protein